MRFVLYVPYPTIYQKQFDYNITCANVYLCSKIDLEQYIGLFLYYEKRPMYCIGIVLVMYWCKIDSEFFFFMTIKTDITVTHCRIHIRAP